MMNDEFAKDELPEEEEGRCLRIEKHFGNLSMWASDCSSVDILWIISTEYVFRVHKTRFKMQSHVNLAR